MVLYAKDLLLHSLVFLGSGRRNSNQCSLLLMSDQIIKYYTFFFLRSSSGGQREGNLLAEELSN